MKQISAACLLVAVLGALVLGQSSSNAPAPSPELKKQDFFVGNWRLEGTTTPSQFGPGGQKFSSTEKLEWMPGGFFLVVHSYSNNKLVEITIIGYSPEDKLFTHTSFNSGGGTEVWKGTAQDGIWTWTKDETVRGKAMKNRLTIRKTSDNSYSFDDEMQTAQGGDWFTVVRGTGIREK